MFMLSTIWCSVTANSQQYSLSSLRTQTASNTLCVHIAWIALLRQYVCTCGSKYEKISLIFAATGTDMLFLLIT